MTDIAGTLLVERIARVLAAWRRSANAEGDLESAALEVDQDWPDCVAAALAVLRTAREPDRGMAALGDVDGWRRMVDAAILGEARLDLPDAGFPAPPRVRAAGGASGTQAGRDRTIDESFPASDPPPASPGPG